MLPPTARALHRTSRLAASLGGFALIGGLLTMLGWITGIRWLTDWENDGISQMPNAGLAMMAAGGGLVLWWLGQRRWSAMLGGFAGLIGAATLFQHVTGIDLGIDRLLISRDWGQRGVVSPGRMGPPASLSLTLIGAAIAFTNFRRTRGLVPVAGLIVCAIGMLSLIGYFFGSDPLYAIPRLTAIALQTSTMVLALAIGLLASVPDRQPVSLLLGESAAAMLVRRALPGVIALPVVLGWLRMRGQEAGLFDTAFGTAMLVLVLSMLLTGVLWWAAGAVRTHESAAEETRERLANILGSITDALMMFDRDWRVVFANEQTVLRTAKRPPEVIGRNVWDVFPDAFGNDAYAELHRAMTERISVEYEVFSPATRRWYADRAYPTADGGLALYSLDVTERKQAEQSLRESEEALRQADRMKDEFLATLSHELRTPLTAVIGWSEMLLRSTIEKEQQHTAFEAINSSAKAQAQLIEDVLDVSRIITGKLRLQREPSSLAAVIEAAIAAVRPAAEAKGIPLRVELHTQLPLQFVDAARIQQVVWNLLSNSIKFSRRDTEVEVSLREERDEAVIEVLDHGCGIRREFLPHIFDRFRQADSSSTRSYTGLGIGLSLVKDLTELHGGRVEVESEDGHGSRFTVRLPKLDATTGTMAAAGPSVSLAGLRLLYVDDREDARVLIARMLREYGAEVGHAASVDEALAKLAHDRPHVVVTDIAMPGRDGYDLLASIRANPAWTDLPVIALTAQVRSQDEARAGAAGFHGFLRKPIHPQTLAAAISRVTRV